MLALLVLRLGLSASISPASGDTGYENTTITETNSTIATNASTSETNSTTNSINLGVSSSNEMSSPNLGGVSTVFHRVLDVGRRFVYTLLSWIRGSDVMETVINGGLLALVFFVLGYIAVAFARVVRVVLYALSVLTLFLTVLMVIGW